MLTVRLHVCGVSNKAKKNMAVCVTFHAADMKGGTQKSLESTMVLLRPSDRCYMSLIS